MKNHDKITSFEPKFNKRKNTLLSFERLHMKDLLFMLYDITAVTVLSESAIKITKGNKMV